MALFGPGEPPSLLMPAIGVVKINDFISVYKLLYLQFGWSYVSLLVWASPIISPMSTDR